MKKQTYQALVLIIVGSCIWTACYKNDLDLDKWRDPLESSWILPLIKAHFTFNDIDILNDFINTNDDGSLDLVYQQDSVILQGAAEYFDIIPDQRVSDEEIAVGAPPTSKLFELDVFEDIRIDQVTFYKGFLHFNFAPETPVGTVVTFTIYNAYKNNEPAIFELKRTAEANSGFFLIDDFEVDIEDFNQDNEVGYEFVISKSPGLNSGDTVLFQWQFSDIQVKEAAGYFGHRSFDFNDGQYDLDFDILSNFDGEFILNNPEIEVSITNPLGVPFQLTPYLTAVSASETNEIELPIITLEGAKSASEPEVKRFSFNRNNSDIVTLLSTMPDQLKFSGQLWSNPQMDISAFNFASRFDTIRVDIAVKIPLDFSAEYISFRQVYDDIEFNMESEAKVQNAIFRFKNENSFPFDAQLKVRFSDKDGLWLDSLLLPIIQAASIDNEGRVTEVNSYTYEVEFDSTQMVQILESRQIELNVLISTPNNIPVTLYDNYFFKTQVSTQADLIYEAGN